MPKEWVGALPAIRLLFLTSFFLFFWQLFIAMLLGIYFLVDRLQFMGDDDAA